MSSVFGNRPISPGLRQTTNQLPSSATSDDTPVPENCPKCGERLISPDSLGWCQHCGFCRSLSDQGVVHRPSVPIKKAKEAKDGAVAFWQMLWVMPRWAWVLLGGVALILGGSMAGDAFLPGDSFWRAVCSTTQLAVGVLLILGTQIYGVLRVSAQDSSLGGREFFLFSPRLWKLIIKELPATRWLVYLESWGVTLLLSAVIIVGNLVYWMQFYQPRAMVDDSLRKAAEAREKGEVGDPLASKSPDADPPVNDVKNDPRPTVQCAIIGYVPDEEGLPVALVLARVNEGKKLVYCGTVKRGFLPKEAEELRDLLTKSVRAEPLIKGLKQEAVWVKAGNYCDIHQSGIDSAGSLIDPSFDKLRLK